MGELQPSLSENPSPEEMHRELLRLGRHLAVYEYQTAHQQAEAHRLKDQYDMMLLMATARLEGKLTETAKRAMVLDQHPQIAQAQEALTTQEAHAMEIRGIRDALRSSYETISRIVSVKQMEIDLIRSGG